MCVRGECWHVSAVIHPGTQPGLFHSTHTLRPVPAELPPPWGLSVEWRPLRAGRSKPLFASCRTLTASEVCRACQWGPGVRHCGAVPAGPWPRRIPASVACQGSLGNVLGLKAGSCHASATPGPAPLPHGLPREGVHGHRLLSCSESVPRPLSASSVGRWGASVTFCVAWMGKESDALETKVTQVGLNAGLVLSSAWLVGSGV